MVAGREAGASTQTKCLSLLDHLADADANKGKMSIKRGKAVAVVYDHVEAVRAAGIAASEGNYSRGGGGGGLVRLGEEVDVDSQGVAGTKAARNRPGGRPNKARGRWIGRVRPRGYGYVLAA